MAYPKVSVLIPAYNAAPFIEETIASVLNQTWPNLEVIVVDDGSNDDTLAKARRYISANIQVVSQQNLGASAARNRAFTIATGDYIQYLDADDLLHPDKIQAQMKILMRQPNTVLSSSAWAMFRTQPDEQLLHPTVIWQDYFDPVHWLLAAWQNGVWMQPSAWLTPRTLLMAAGPWDEKLSLHDDGEFFCRVLLRSSAIHFCAAAKSFYRKGLSKSLSSIRSPKAVQSHLAVCKLYEKHLLTQRNTAVTRRACADNFQRFIYEYYPECPELLHEAAKRVNHLGGSTIRPVSTPMFRLVDKLIGWKASKRLQNFIYHHKLNPAAWYTAARG